MKFISAVIFCVLALAAAPTFAQAKPANTAMQILFDKVKADKKRALTALSSKPIAEELKLERFISKNRGKDDHDNQATNLYWNAHRVLENLQRRR